MWTLPGGAIGALLCCLSSPGLAQDAATWSAAGGWSIVVDPALDNGCSASMAYDTGTVLRIGINRLANRGYITVASKAWPSMVVGQEYDLRLIFGSTQPWDVAGTAVNLDGATTLWLNFIDVDLILDFMQEPSVQLWYNDRMLDQLSLTGSFAAFSEVVRCQGAMDTNSAPTAVGAEPLEPPPG